MEYGIAIRSEISYLSAQLVIVLGHLYLPWQFAVHEKMLTRILLCPATQVSLRDRTITVMKI